MSLICRNCTIWASRVEYLIGVDIRENDGNEVVKTDRRTSLLMVTFRPAFVTNYLDCVLQFLSMLLLSNSFSIHPRQTTRSAFRRPDLDTGLFTSTSRQ